MYRHSPTATAVNNKGHGFNQFANYSKPISYILLLDLLLLDPHKYMLRKKNTWIKKGIRYHNVDQHLICLPALRQVISSYSKTVTFSNYSVFNIKNKPKFTFCLENSL